MKSKLYGEASLGPLECNVQLDPFVVEKYLSIVGNEVD
jgi:hypothetical protein